MRRTTVIVFSLLLSLLVMSGCGNSGKNAANPNRENATLIHNEGKEGGSIDTGNGYGFTEFDLDIEVDGKDAIEADFDSTEASDAEFENYSTKPIVKLKGTEAMKELDKLFVHIRMTSDMAEKDIIDKVTEFYNIKSYSKFELEIYFDDGTHVTILDRA